MAIFNINTTFFRLFNESPELRDVFAGEIFIGESPENHEFENITINTLNVNHGRPQTGTTNINIHVPDLLVDVNGVEQYIADENRINEIVSTVVGILDVVTITEFGFKITNESMLENGREHYVNLRLDWVTSGNNIMLENKYYTRDEVDELLRGFISESELNALAVKVDGNTADIASNKSRISSLAWDIKTNSDDIAESAKTIGILSQEIETNTGDIATIAAASITLSNKVTALENDSHVQNTDTALDGNAVVVLQESDAVQVNKKMLVADEITANVVNAETIVKVHAEEVTIDNNVIVLRGGSESAIPADSWSGIIIKNYDGAKDMALMCDSGGIWSIGDVTQNDAGEIVIEDLRPLTTRADSSAMVGGDFVKWDAANMSIADSGISTAKIGTMDTAISANATEIGGLKTTTATHTASISLLQTNKLDKISRQYMTLSDYEALTTKNPDVDYFIYEEG